MNYSSFRNDDLRRAVVNDLYPNHQEEALTREELSLVEKNCPQLECCLVCWVAVLEDCKVDDFFTEHLLSLIWQIGFIPVAKYCKEVADDLLRHLEEDAHSTPVDWLESLSRASLWFERREADFQSPIGVLLYQCRESLYSSCGGNSSALLHSLLQALLFPVRFTYIGASPASSEQKFKSVNATCRDYEYNWQLWPGPTVISMVRTEMGKILGRKLRFTWDDCSFTNGSTNCTGKDKLSKWAYYAQYHPSYLDDVRYPFPGGQNSELPWWDRDPKLLAVPKSFDAFRIIAPENPLVNFYANGALEALRRALKRSGAASYINERDQECNRELAHGGSFHEDVATIDMSSASDSISKAVFFAVLPMYHRGFYLDFQSYYVKLLDGTRKKLFTLFTSGNPLTWLTEAVYFLAIARVGTALAGFEDAHKLCFAYGDDLIVPSGAYQTVVELLQLFGHTVNVKKSYVDSLFRESCGGWFYAGVDITPVFWPRREVGPSFESLYPALVSVQHNCYRAGWRYPALFARCRLLGDSLCNVCGIVPTYSYVNSDYEDMWDTEVDNYVSCDSQPHISVRNRESMPVRTAFLDHLVYYEYLREGPMYMDPLAKLLGVSSSRFSSFKSVSNSLETIVR